MKRILKAKMKYIQEIKIGYIVCIRCPDKTYRESFLFTDFVSKELALIAATIYRDKVCKLEQIPVVGKYVCKKSHNKTGFYYTHKVNEDKYRCNNQKIENPEDSIPIVNELDVKRYGMPVKRKTIKKETSWNLNKPCYTSKNINLGA